MAGRVEVGVRCTSLPSTDRFSCMAKRDGNEFTPQTKQHLARSVNYMCSKCGSYWLLSPSPPLLGVWGLAEPAAGPRRFG